MPPTSPPTRLLLVRHGATVLTDEDRFAGSTDVPLSDTGRAQAAALAGRLRGVRLAAIVASTLGRARETAEILAAPHGQPVATDARLCEIAHGHWEGMTRDEVEARFPREADAWDHDPFTYTPPGGESGLSVTARALPAILDLAEAHAGGTVLVVSHKATIRLVLSLLLGFDPRRYRDTLDQLPAALNVVDVRAGRARLRLFNDTSHYDGAAALPPSAEPRLSPDWAG